MNHITLVKLGGSLITDKAKPFTARPEVIRRLAREIKAVFSVKKHLKIILAHGSGSFGHIPATKYGTANGFTDLPGKLGACITHDVAAQINRIVITQFLEVGLPVVSVMPSSFLTAENGRLDKTFFQPVAILLQHNLIPVVYGDVIWDRWRGSSIFSGETTLGIIARHLLASGWLIDQNVECGIEEGARGKHNKIIPLITEENFPQFKKYLGGSGSTDVTGGMLHKVKQGLELAKYGIETIILNGNRPYLLRDALLGKRVLGTRISA